MHKIQISQLPGNTDIPLLKKMSEGSSGFDLCAAVQEPVMIHPGEIVLISTGISIAMPSNLEAQVRSRSGLALNNGVCVLNSPGTIDSDYRGEIRVILYNVSSKEFQVKRGDRVAQLVFQEIAAVQFQIVQELHETSRGVGGFGSTGVR